MAQDLFDTPAWAVVQGASRGIGAATLQALLEQSAICGVVGTSRTPKDVPLFDELTQRYGARFHAVSLDLERPETITTAAGAVRERLGGEPLRLLINASGLLHDAELRPEKRWEDLSPEGLSRAFAVNASGPVLVARALLPCFPRTGRSIIASLSARVGSISDNRLGGWYAYRASKAAQNMLTKTLAIELARRLPDCLCVGLHPGTVATDLSAPFQAGVPEEKLFSTQRAAAQLLAVLAGLSGRDSGACFAWDGQRIEP